MPAKFTLEIITPERSFFRGEIESVIIPTSDGYMSVQRMHEPMVCTIEIGTIRFLADGEWKECATSEGFMEVRPDETVVFAQTVEWPHEIDLRRAQEAKEKAEEQLRQKKSHEEYMASKIALARAMVRLRVGRRDRNIE